MARGDWVRRRIVAVIVAGCALSACGSGSDRDAGVPAGGGGSAGAGSAPAATTVAADCPLTADEVGAAVGAEVTGPDSSCSFFPANEDKMLPSAAYVRQVSFACSGNIPLENEYTETVDGLGAVTYVADRADGSWLLVCRSGAPFEIRVDAGNREAARAAATALARQVLSEN